MREIKFRVFNTVAKIMYPKEHFGLSMDGAELQLMPECEHYDKPFLINKSGQESMIFMQYTGLKGRNGKEIYEGSIVKSQEETQDLNDPDIEFWVVEYSEEKASFIIVSDGEEESLSYYDNLEVIGDIYQNPELIK